MKRQTAINLMVKAHTEMQESTLIKFSEAKVDPREFRKERETIISRIMGGTDPKVAVEDGIRHTIFLHTQFAGSGKEFADQSAALAEALRSL